MRRAFTLIELLIVVAIIAILAAIAVPNFLEAQTRAKVSRVKSDLRTITTAIQSYAVDNNAYPPHLIFPGGVETEVNYPDRYAYLTSPISYMTSIGNCIDPFIRQPETGAGGSLNFYSWTNFASFKQRPGGSPLLASLDTHRWLLRSRGPDGRNEANSVRNAFMSGGIAAGPSMVYDATNGTVSVGDVFRTAVYTP